MIPLTNLRDGGDPVGISQILTPKKFAQFALHTLECPFKGV